MFSLLTHKDHSRLHHCESLNLGEKLVDIPIPIDVASGRCQHGHTRH